MYYEAQKVPLCFYETILITKSLFMSIAERFPLPSLLKLPIRTERNLIKADWRHF